MTDFSSGAYEAPGPQQFVFATRKSALALAQSRAFVAALVAASPGLDVGELHITTSGDRFQDQRLSDIGGKGLFIKELEEALLDGRAQFAVHSIKDVPAELPPGLAIVCVPLREDPRDVLVTKEGGPLASLRQGAVVGTSSLRRALCLKEARPDLVIEPLRGNVDTRLRKVAEGPYDAIVLARAGLVRLGLADRASEVLEPTVCLPAVGQGALGIECALHGSERLRAALAKLHHRETAIAVAAERAVMATVGGNCRMPIAAHAVRDGDENPAGSPSPRTPTMWLRAFVAESDGSRVRRGERRAPWPSSEDEAQRLGADLGRELA